MRRVFLFMALCLLFSAAAYADDPAVAKVNGVAITARDVEVELDRLLPRSSFHGKVKPDARASLRDQAIENLIVKRLQYQDAVEQGMKPNKKQVKARMSQIRDKFTSKSNYKAALAQAGVSDEELQARVAQEILIQAVTDKMVNEPARMSDSALREHYDKNVSKFKQPESVRLYQISTKDEKKANQAFSKIKSGQDFSAIAASMSEDDFRVKGGDMGFIHRGRLKIPELEAEAFRLKPGEASKPIVADGVWYIIKITEKKPERQVNFEEIKVKLKTMLEMQRSSELMEKWMTGLHAKAKIERSANPEKEKKKQ